MSVYIAWPTAVRATSLETAGRWFALGIGDPEAMARMPFTAHGFRLRPVAEVEAALAAAGLDLKRHTRLGGPGPGFHLLVTGLASS